MDSYVTLREAEKKERGLQQKAENFENFGSLTSLGSTAVWFGENALGKTVPRSVSAVSLAAVSVGIGSVLYSYKLRHDAAKVALNDDELLILRNPAGAGLNPVPSKSWADKRDEPAPAAFSR